MKRWLICLAALVMVMVGSAGCSPQKTPAAGPSEGRTEILYFYDNPCEACDDEAEFIELMQLKMGDVLQPERYSLTMVNGFRDASGQFDEACDLAGIPQEQRITPMVIIGDGWLTGEEAIGAGMRNLYCTQAGLTDTKTIWVYQRPTCPDCANVEDQLHEAMASYKDYSFIWVDTTEQEPKQAFKDLLAQMGVPDEEWQIPFLIRDGQYLSGDEAIIQHLDDFITGQK